MEITKLVIKEPVTKKEFIEIFNEHTEFGIKEIDDFNINLFNDYIISSVHFAYVMDNLKDFNFTLNMGDNTCDVICTPYTNKFMDYNEFVYSNSNDFRYGIKVSLPENKCNNKSEFERMNSMSLHHYRHRSKYSNCFWTINSVMCDSIDFQDTYKIIFRHFVDSILSNIVNKFTNVYNVMMQFREYHQHPYFEPIETCDMKYIYPIYARDYTDKLISIPNYNIGYLLSGMYGVYTGSQHKYIQRVRDEVFVLLKENK